MICKAQDCRHGLLNTPLGGMEGLERIVDL